MSFIILIYFLFSVKSLANEDCECYEYFKCCDCCDYDKDKNFEVSKDNPKIDPEAYELITEDEIKKAEEYYGEPKEITPTTSGVLQHLKLDDDKLNNIVEEINKIPDNTEKIEKIIEYSKDIDWDKPMCPNTLIKHEHNACSIISYFHLMLNNPYFVKFFLICDKIDSLHKDDTYMLNAICDLVRWCVNHPKFDKNENNMGSVEPILNALFIKEKDDEEYFYCKKEKESNLGNDLYKFYHESDKDSNGKESLINYGDFLYPSYIWKSFYKFLFVDFNINKCNIDLKKILQYKIEVFIDYYIKRLLGCIPKPDGEKMKEIEKYSKSVGDTAGKTHIEFHFEKQMLPNFKKLLGLMLNQYKYHIFTLVNYNGVWYNKNTLVMEDVKKMSIREVLALCNEIFKSQKQNKESDTGELSHHNSVINYI